MAKAVCPYCGCELFYNGPRGGLNQNILCAGCYTEFQSFGMTDMHSTDKRIKEVYGINRKTAKIKKQQKKSLKDLYLSFLRRFKFK